MKICVVTERKRGAFQFSPADIVLFPFGIADVVSYSNELAGKTDFLERLARLSGTSGSALLCGVITDSRGLMRKSVAVAANGRLLGIADMLNVLDGEEYKSGAGVGVYTVGGYKVGLCIDSDLFFPEHLQTLSMCGCNLIAVHAEDITDGIAPVLIRAYAYLYGIPIVLCCAGAAYFADITGVIASSNQRAAVFETFPKNCYRTVTVRRKGIVSAHLDDY